MNHITVAIPTYNRNEYLVKLLRSIPANIGVVVSDNGGYVTEEIKKEFPNAEFFTPPTVLKMYENWNFCLKHVKTDWFVIPSDDDLYYGGAFETINQAIERNADCGMLLFGHDVIDEHDKVKSTWSVSAEETLEAPQGFLRFCYGVDARLPSIIFNTRLTASLGFFDEQYEFTAADSLLIQKCSLLAKVSFHPAKVAAYRTWSNNFTSQLISSMKWLDKIDYWQNDLISFINRDFKNQFQNLDLVKVRDEVYAQNLLAGLNNEKDRKKAFSFFSQARKPYKAKFVTRVNLLKALTRKLIPA